jgi:hypothetical protein
VVGSGADSSRSRLHFNVGRLGLKESMQRFDASRCISVVKSPAIEHPLDHNDETGQDEKPAIH